MKKPVILALCIAVLLSASAMASMQCSVVPFNSCPQASVKVIGMTSLSSGGSHASIPSEQANALVACCSGVEGLSVSYANENASIYLTEARDAHVSRVTGENGLKLTADSTLSCGYFNDCRDYEACVFSISADRDAHIGDCGNYAFSTKLCCRKGRLIGEEIPISPEETLTEEIRSIPASPQEGTGIVEQAREDSSGEEQPSVSKAIRVPLPSNVRNFLRNLLRSRFADLS
ncbi:MAG: hypothetical protein V1734_01965 [Nanoarchaeota archaeon]